jgi:hypothetical protein
MTWKPNNLSFALANTAGVVGALYRQLETTPLSAIRIKEVER